MENSPESLDKGEAEIREIEIDLFSLKRSINSSHSVWVFRLFF